MGRCTVGDPLPGATTATVVPVVTDAHRYVLKWFTWDRFLAEDRGRVAHEVFGLELGRSAGLPTPEVVATDPDGSVTGHPAILMTAVSGSSLPRPRDWPEQAARAAVRLHQLEAPCPYRHSSFFPGPFAPQWATDPRLWSDAIAVCAELEPTTEAIIHRDFHRWNMHWHEDRLAGIVDWLSVCAGPIGEDVARVWVNEFLEGQPAEGRAFRDAYLETSQRSWDMRWELQSVLDMLPVYESDDAVHNWGDEVSRRRLEDCLRFALGLL